MNTATAAFIFAFIVACGILGAKAELVDHHIIDPQDLRNLTLPPSQHTYDNWTDWESWEASPESAKLLPYFRSGYDNDGLIVYVADFGKWSNRDLTHLPEDKIQEFWKYYEQFERRMGRDSALNNGQGIVHVNDWDGFSLKQYTSKPAIHAAVKMFAEILKFAKYIKYGFHLNVNYSAEWFINTARGFLGQVLDKFEIEGTRIEKWKPKLLQNIKASQLPPKLGGTNDWKPLPLK